MVKCASCGAENRDGAKYCDQCTAQIVPGDASSGGTESVQDQSSSKDMSQMEKQMERDAEKLAAGMEKCAERAGRNFTEWYDRRFGLVGPIISGLMWVVVCILVLVILAVISGEHPFWVHLRDFVILYLPLFIVLSVFGRYSEYLRRRRVKGYRPFDPILTAISVVAGLWIFIQVLEMLGEDMGWESIADFASSLENASVFVTISVLVIAIGALLSIQRVIAPDMFMPPKTKGPEPPRQG